MKKSNLLIISLCVFFISVISASCNFKSASAEVKFFDGRDSQITILKDDGLLSLEANQKIQIEKHWSFKDWRMSYHKFDKDTTVIHNALINGNHNKTDYRIGRILKITKSKN